MEKFEYLGLRFEPVREFTKDEKKYEVFQLKLSESDLTPTGYSYYQFTDIAEKNGHKNIDLFLVANRLVTPGFKCLYEWKE